MEQGRFEKLFESGQIGEMTIRNRIVMPAMGTNFATEEGFVSERQKAYYEERAIGGVRLIVTEIACVQAPVGRATKYQVGVDDDRFIPGLSELTEAVKRHGAKIALQLHHAGMETKEHITGCQPVGPSQLAGWRHQVSRELTKEEITEIVDCFAEAAQRAQEAGFDGVEIHAAHYYLLAQFLSSAWNKREDAYGGPLENRARFLLETIRAIRKAVGPSYPVWSRINGEEYGFEGGLTKEEGIEIALMTKEAGADAVHVSAMGGGAEALKGVTVRQRGALVDLAADVKKAVGIPVIAVGRIDPVLAEDVLANAKADFVAMGRGLIADAEVPQKASMGSMKHIRPCINCLKCVERVSFQIMPLECSVNAAVGMERRARVEKTKEPRSVLVIGGGPAGMEAARMVALRGHQVRLYEQKPAVGGAMLAASKPPGKEDIQEFVDYLSIEMRSLGVEIELGTYVTPEFVRKVDPDAIVVATGATLVLPDIPGIGGHQVMTATDVLTGNAETGKNVVVIGGGMIGCEVAELLVSRGRKVSIVEAVDRLAGDMMPMVRRPLLDRLIKKGVTTYTGVKVEEITQSGVSVIDKFGKMKNIPGDTFVMAVGAKSNRALTKMLGRAGLEVHVVGDCLEPRGIREAVKEGFNIGLLI